MDKINIKNLFYNNNKNNNNKLNQNYFRYNEPKKEQFGPLNVYTLFNPQKKNKTDLKFDIESLINRKKIKKEKILVEYKKIFNMCLRKILTANRLDKNEIIYEVPIGLFGFDDYSSSECINYLNEELKKMYFDLLILSNNSIFISWEDLENNMKKIKNINDRNTDNRNTDNKVISTSNKFDTRYTNKNSENNIS